MKLPKLRLKPASIENRERLSRWLKDWDLSKELADTTDSSTRNIIHLTDATDFVNQSGNPLTIGQIRLFLPTLLPPDCGPRYFAVLKTENDTALVAPFGLFAEPCHPHEYLTGRETACLRVLCMWNRAALSRHLAEQCWLADELTVDELQDTQSMLEHITTSIALTEELTARAGPPCWHPADPRKEYLMEERKLMSCVKNACQLSQMRYPDHDSSLDIAAEDRDPWAPDK